MQVLFRIFFIHTVVIFVSSESVVIVDEVMCRHFDRKRVNGGQWLDLQSREG
jgi:hypothetical protein